MIQDVCWPGVIAAEGCRGTISHGISPSLFILTTYPQTAAPEDEGDLTLTDGQREIVLHGCRVDRITGTSGPGGQTWTLEIQDRRWRWRGFGAISGSYNQLDPHGKLIPWTIRSPTELATICLDAMEEEDYEIDLPPGLQQADGEDLERYLKLGEQFPETLANPPVTWDHTPPAEALARLCDGYGRRVVYQPIQDRVIIAPLGVGEELPDGPVEVQTPALTAPPLPDAVAVAGAHSRFQARFLLEAVGKEWDGSYVPINELSYAPMYQAQAQVTTVTISSPQGGSDTTTTLTITAPPPASAPAGPSITGTYVGDGVGLAPVSVAAQLAAKINADAKLQGVLTAAANNNVLTLTGARPGMPFTVVAALPIAPTTVVVATPKTARPNGGSWAYSAPPGYSLVRETKRLSRHEAQALARASVFRCYRITPLDPATGEMPLVIPGYGPITRRQQIVLQPTKVEQVVPQPPNFAGRQIGVPGGAIQPEFYNGYSRDQQPVVYGSIYRLISSVVWTGLKEGNTPAEFRVYNSFQIEPGEQMVVFDSPVFRRDGGGSYPARLVLETACLVADPETGEVDRGEWELELNGTAPTEWEIREDIPHEIVGQYDTSHQLTGIEVVSEDDADPRAQYYLNGLAAKHQTIPGESRQYIGLYPIDPDGLIQQVSWSLGKSGPTTTASANGEHSTVVPAYPARRRAENLSPNALAANQNMKSGFNQINLQAGLAAAAKAGNTP